MAFGSSSSAVLRAIREVTFGVTPNAGNPVNLRMTGEDLKFNISKEASKEINKSRTNSSMAPVSASASGPVNSEIRYRSNDDLMAATLQSSWTEFGTGGEGAATTVDATATTLTASAATSGVNNFANIKLGQWLRISSNGANDGKIVRASATVAATNTVLTLDANTPLVVSAGEIVKLQTSRLTHGATQVSYTLERENSDIGVFMAFRGMTPSKMSLSIADGALSGMNFDFMGRDAEESNATLLPGVPVDSPAYEVHSGVAGKTLAIWMDGAPLTGTAVKSVSLDFDNALRNQGAIGVLGAAGIGSGTIACQLTMQVYFSNKDSFTKFRKNQNSGVIFSSTDLDGNGYIFTIPKGNTSDWKSNASQKDQDQMVDLTFTALEDSNNPVAALRKLLFIDRVGVAAV